MARHSKRSRSASASATSGRRALFTVIGGPSAWLAAIVLAILVGAVYGRSLRAPFIFDDRSAIVYNKSITRLWPLVGTPIRPGPLATRIGASSTGGRPLVNLSLAVNYHFGGLNPTGYHLVNLLLHFCSAMLVWAVTRRTLLLPYFGGRFDRVAGWLSLAVALIWALHPLNTEAVVYVTQRNELMMAFFYLATLYCSLRYWLLLPLSLGEDRGEGALPQRIGFPVDVGPKRTLWLALAVLACLCGMASKEVMVSAPVIVLLFERAFISGSLRNSLRRSWPLYLGLVTTWLLLLTLNLTWPRGDTAGFGVGVSVYAWWLTQCKVLLMYLKLVIWPWPLVLHYEMPYLTTIRDGWIYVLPVVLLGIVTLVLLWRNRPAGFLATWGFAILLPTSVVPIRTEIAAERRMYLPTVALVALIVVGGYGITQKLLSRSFPIRVAPSRRATSAVNYGTTIMALSVLSLAFVFALVSAKRLTAYDDEIRLWKEVVREEPNNIVAHSSLGMRFLDSSRMAEATHEFEILRTLEPDDPAPLENMGICLAATGHFSEAIEKFKQALDMKPDSADLLTNLGSALIRVGRLEDAVQTFQAALKLEPDSISALNNMGNALIRLGRLPEAIEKLKHAIDIDPDYAKARATLGIALGKSGKTDEAIEQLRMAIRLDPNDVASRRYLDMLIPKKGS